MEIEDALKFLESYQPMPPDREIDDDLIKKYDSVRKYFLKNKDVRCVPLFLNSFGFIDGFGVYQLVEDVITMYDEREVIPSLISSLSSSYYSVRYWSAQIASNFSSEALINPLGNLLNENEYDIKFASLAAIEINKSYKKKVIIENYLLKEKDDELQNMANNILDNISG